MSLEFIDLNFPPVLAVNCDNGKAMEKEKLRRTRFDKSTKNDNIECRRKNDIMEIKFEVNKELECK